MFDKNNNDNQKFVKEIVEMCSVLHPDGFHLNMCATSSGINIDLEVAKNDSKQPQSVPAKAKTYDALDALYNQPKTEEQIAKETEERNRKLKEKFNSQGNVIPNGGHVAAWSGDEQ